MDVRIIIPCFNEENVIELTYNKLTEILQKDSKINSYNYNLLFIDDGSSDNTLSILKKLSYNDNRVNYLSFSRNFGKESAMYAGLQHSLNYDATIIIDSDLQHPPALIPEMIQKYYEGYDQVIAQRNRLGENVFRKIPTKAYYFLINKLVDTPIVDGIGDFRLLSKRVVNTIVEMEERQRFSKGLFSWVGYKQTIIKFNNVSRDNGESKWTFKNLLDYGIDGILSFNNKPLRIILYLGFLILGISILYILINFFSIVINGVTAPGYFTMIFSVLFLGSIQLISLGIVGEYIGRIYYEVKNRPHYIKQESNIDSDE